jgi:hypothetical protein
LSLAGLRGPDRGQELRDERLEVCQPVRPRPQNDHRHRQRRKILLERQIAIDGNEDIKRLRRQREQLPFSIEDQPIWRAVMT